MEKSKFEKLKEYATKFMKFGAEKTQEEKDAEATAEAEKAKEVKFDAVKIKDGETMVEYNPSLEVGTPVMISGGTGSTAATDGAYILSNGVAFTVKDGKIESVEDTGELEADKTPNEVIEKMSAQIVELQGQVTKLEGLFSKIDFSAIPTKEEILAFSKEVVKFGSDVSEVIDELGKIPVNVPKTEEAEPEVKQAINFSAVASKFAT